MSDEDPTPFRDLPGMARDGAKGMAGGPLGVHVSQGARSGNMVASKARFTVVPGLNGCGGGCANNNNNNNKRVLAYMRDRNGAPVYLTW